MLPRRLRRRGVQPKSGRNILVDAESNQITAENTPADVWSPTKIGEDSWISKRGFTHKSNRLNLKKRAIALRLLS